MGFVLSDQHGEKVNLEDLRERKVILSFHPLAFTPVCAKQMRALEENQNEFARLGAVAESYGIFRAVDGYCELGVIILDEEGIVRWSKVYPISEVPDMGEILEQLRNQGG